MKDTGHALDDTLSSWLADRFEGIVVVNRRPRERVRLEIARKLNKVGWYTKPGWVRVWVNNPSDRELALVRALSPKMNKGHISIWIRDEADLPALQALIEKYALAT